MWSHGAACGRHGRIVIGLRERPTERPQVRQALGRAGVRLQGRLEDPMAGRFKSDRLVTSDRLEEQGAKGLKGR